MRMTAPDTVPVPAGAGNLSRPFIGLSTYGIAHADGFNIPAQYVQAMGTDRVTIVSWHHQAVDQLGTGLRPVAWAEDGVIEAMELDGNPKLLAVQWYPELSAAEDATPQGLFDRLVALAGKA